MEKHKEVFQTAVLEMKKELGRQRPRSQRLSKLSNDLKKAYIHLKNLKVDTVKFFTEDLSEQVQNQCLQPVIDMYVDCREKENRVRQQI